MPFLRKLVPTADQWRRLALASFLGALAFFLLWKGGKPLEATWLLTVLAWICTYQFWKTDSKEGAREPLWLWGILMLFVAWTFVSYLNTATGNYGLDEVLRTGALVLMLLWVRRRAADGSGALESTMMRTIAVATFVACGVGWVVYVLQPVERFVGTFFDYRFHTDYWPNAWAEYLLLVWPLTALWAERVVASWKKERYPWAETLMSNVIIGALFGSLLLSYSRGGSIAFLLQLGLWGYLLSRREMKRGWKRPLAEAAAVFAVALIAFAGINSMRSQFYAVQSAAEKITFTAAEGTSSITERNNFWQDATTLALERPFFGWGPYSYRFLQPRMQDAILATSDHAHNVILKYAAERGLVPAALFAGFLLLLFSSSFLRSLRNTEGGKRTLEIREAMFVGAVGVIAHNMIDFNLQFVGIALPLWAFFGILSNDIPLRGILVPKNVARTVEVVLVTVLMVVAVVEGRHMLLSSLGRHAEARQDYATATKWYEASRAQKYTRDMHLSRAHVFLEMEDVDRASSALSDYFAQNGEDGRAWKLRGDVCRAQRDWECAIMNYEKAYALIRYNGVDVLHALIGTLRDAGRKEEIDARREEFDALTVLYGEAIERNAHYIALSGNVPEFLSLLQTLAVLYPEDEPRYAVIGAKAELNARMEQERLKGRKSGYLW
ncbi:MAG: O-antigen ligase family protein [Candidatus Peribacteraceae bacterium]|nr:O-antigen ligase family protein [Candidatus Peribacteraceae bacterium]